MPRSAQIRLFVVLVRTSLRGQALDESSSITCIACPSLSLRTLVVISSGLTSLETFLSFQTLAWTGWTTLFPRLDAISTSGIVVFVIVVVFAGRCSRCEFRRSPTLNHSLILVISDSCQKQRGTYLEIPVKLAIQILA
jgi:hypothetical protein